MRPEEDAAWEDDEAPGAREARPLYRDPFEEAGAAGAPCRRILALPQEARERAQRSCPRCGGAGQGGSWLGSGSAGDASGGRCILQGVDLDVRAYEGDDRS